MPTQHPELDILSGYSLEPSAREYADVRRHLLACELCRDKVSRLEALAKHVTHAIPRMHDHTHNVDNVKNSAANQEKFALKSALHYSTHSAAMQRAINAQQIKLKNFKSQKVNIIGTLQAEIRAWLNWRMPAWTAVPAVLVLALMVNILLIPEQVTHNTHIAVYQDKPVVEFSKQNAPANAIGFFGAAATTSTPFAGMKVSLSGENTLHFQWPEIAQAATYRFELSAVSGGSITVIANQDVAANEITITNQLPRHEPHHGIRYEWRLSGTTADDQQFQTKGGFVLTSDTTAE